jgi:hypothetical protein
LYRGDQRISIVSDGEKGEAAPPPIMLEIHNSRGTIFLNGEIDTVLTAKVIQDGKDITDQFTDENFSWTKFDAEGKEDVEWGQ